ncbi:amino acid ABC transporter permease [Limosilactobacillus fastidiosus]|uniref:Amino acid ABC transporter permease n=1 Tax=Limosilactobacillus fastidiosus TaxID=2759855 RepID=A0A7W3U014_9LACO|nr:amino acid ABC transporter permease [Limosilactobacillus fastidiosus]MBB1086441.1 amino acid ABC transporter permease [Limosilactobacillus fastidiosus]MCD7086320.1 amino acid ABC transporter permease [Limosilactobacillus fastidiosus]MCD7114899.1 amino acid ABC transporter permease [Limosilactobacillus fastidiosus]MCD7116883.1 amino acid ABC transporter permease [Limosilactobacillus fastidiosus]
MWEIIRTSLPQLLAAGFKYTIPLALISFFFGLIIALVTALIRLSYQRGPFILLKWFAQFYVWLFRSTPLLVQLFIVFFGLPYLRIKGIFPYGIKLEPFTAGIVTFSLNTGAYASETIRAAISSVAKGQWEAGAAIGMTRLQILWRIIIPQALQVALPPLSNSFISLVKDTSLAASITIMEMFEVSQQIAAANYQPLLMYTLVALIYAVFTTVLTIIQHYLEKRLGSQIRIS